MPSANHTGGPGTKGKSFKGPKVKAVKPGETFYGSKTRHGTTSGYSKHGLMGEDACEMCRIAQVQYNARRLASPEGVLRNRLRAKAQSAALRDLRKKHEEEYRVLYAMHRDALLDQAALEQRQTQPFKRK